MNKHAALIWISTDLMAGLKRLQHLVGQLEKIGSVAQVSSIYKKFLSGRSEDLNSNLVMVLRLNTALEMNELFDGLQTLEGNRDVAFGGTQENLLLLSYDQEIRMMPGENLPSPKLHTDTLTLRCAAEAWGDYRHPVLGQTLQELVRLSDPLKHVEFFAQGRILFSGETT